MGKVGVDRSTRKIHSNRKSLKSFESIELNFNSSSAYEAGKFDLRLAWTDGKTEPQDTHYALACEEHMGDSPSDVGPARAGAFALRTR